MKEGAVFEGRCDDDCALHMMSDCVPEIDYICSWRLAWHSSYVKEESWVYHSGLRLYTVLVWSKFFYDLHVVICMGSICSTSSMRRRMKSIF